jgi:hypothetical protein
MANRNDKFFQRLTRIFSSGPSVMRRVKGFDYRSYYDNDLIRGNQGYRAPFPFGRENSPFSTLGAYGILDRTARYSEFAEMETEPIIAAALNVWADEVAAGDEQGKALHLYSRNPEIKKNLEELFYDVLNVDFNLRSWARNLVKYGDFFLYLEVVPDIGVINVQPIPVNELEREEGFDASDPYSVRFKWITRGNRYLENWQVLHMRILGNDLLLPYGVSLLEPARRVYRQLQMMEDAMLVYRVERCLHGDSRVWTTSGYKKIVDIKVGDKVQSYDYKNNKIVLSKVVDWHDNGPKRIWEVKTKHRTIKTSDNHPILTKNIKTGEIDYVLTRHLNPEEHLLFLPTLQANKQTKIKLNEEKYEWFAGLNDQGKTAFRKFSSLNKGEVSSLIRAIATETSYSPERIKGFLYAKPGKVKALPKEVAEAVCNYLSLDLDTNLTYAPKGMYNLDRLNIPEYVNEDFARFFGFMLGDGSVSKCKHKICFATGTSSENNEKYRNLLQEYCGKVSFNQDKRRKDSYGGILGAYQAHSYYFANLMEDMGYIPGAHNKRIPTWVFESSDEIKTAFIEGLIDADGHVRTQRNTESYEIELCNDNLINDLKELCHQLGWNVSSDVYKRTKKQRTVSTTGKTIKETTSYSIAFTKQKTPGLEKVISVKETNEVSNVYDIRVDNDLHNFVADGVVVHNSPERRVFYIDVANIPPNDVPGFVEAAKATMRSRDVVDKSTGRMDRRHNPLNMLEDFYIPVRGNQSGTKIETLAGATNATATEDVEYLQKKLFSAIQVPKAYLNYVENMGAKASLSQLDIRFSRTISVLQRIILAELNKLAMIHLYSKGFDGEDLINFELKLSNPSTVALQQKLEVLSTKIDIAGKAKESGLVDQEWIQKKILELTQEEVARIEIGKRKDKIRDVEIEAIAVAENLPDPNSKIDAFDSSNYTLPGSDVARNAGDVDQNSTTDFDKVAPILASQKQAFAGQKQTIGNQSGMDREFDNNYRVKDADGNYLPISASPFTYSSKRKKDRRVGAGGRDNLNMPDFKSMVSGTDKYSKDVFGSTDLNLKRSLFESISDDFEAENDEQILEKIFAAPMRLPGEMKNIFASIDRKFGKRNRANESMILTEDINTDDKPIDIDLEIVESDDVGLLDPAGVLSEVNLELSEDSKGELLTLKEATSETISGQDDEPEIKPNIRLIDLIDDT